MSSATSHMIAVPRPPHSSARLWKHLIKMTSYAIDADLQAPWRMVTDRGQQTEKDGEAQLRWKRHGLFFVEADQPPVCP